MPFSLLSVIVKPMKTIKNRKVGTFTIILLMLFFSIFIPLSLTLVLWRVMYWGSTTRALGLSQIESTLNGATQLLNMYSPLTGGIPDTEGFAQLKRLLNGPIVSFRFGPFTPEDLQIFLQDFLETKSLCVSDTHILDDSGREIGKQNPSGEWVLTAAHWVSKGAYKWDSLLEEQRRRYANAKNYVQVSRDISKAVVRLGNSGYLWAISAATNPDMHCFELIHPQLEGIDITYSTNSKKIRVGFEIASLRGLLLSPEADKIASMSDIVRFDYSWKNPEDLKERSKIVLMRYIKSHNFVLAAGLYENEYFMPAQAAEQLFIFLIFSMAVLVFAFMFLFFRKIARSLVVLSNYAEMTARSDGTIHRLSPTGFREMDKLSESFARMEEEILKRETNLVHELQEKDALIQEVHHRVKNNLSVLISMISLQIQQVQSEDALDALNQLQGRVNSMALVYQQLFGANQYTHLPFDEYVRGILAYYQSGYNGGRIERKESLNHCEIELERAVPLGLIVNELVSNAFTHGIPHNRLPKIEIGLTTHDKGIEFFVEDNGNGYQNHDKEKTGMLLVRALCTQLKAELLIESPLDAEGGCRVTVKVPYKAT